MPINLTMPALSPTMEEGTLATWLVAEGDRIEAGDIIAEIETDKATMEYEAPEAGVLAKIITPVGSENVAVNTIIAILAVDGENPATIKNAKPPVSNLGARPAPEVGAHTAMGQGQPSAAPLEKTRIAASPLARRAAQMAGLDIAAVSGSGPNGRVVRRDVEAAAASHGLQQASPPGETPSYTESAAPNDAAGLYREGSYEVVELDAMRRTISRRLTESKQTVPHFYLRTDVALDALLALRQQLNAVGPKGGSSDNVSAAYRISVNDMVIKALACALREVPDANVTWADGCVLRHKSVDVAVAVAIDGGLITPVIRDAETKSLSTIGNEMKDLAQRARARKLTPPEYQGGTTSVSNLGMFGVSSFDAVINPPQGTILAVGAGEKRAIVRGDEIVVATTMMVTLSVDHRAVDGVLGAGVLAAFKRHVENPLTMLV